MSYRIAWTDTAMRRVTEILDHISEADPEAARRIIDEIFDRVQLLSEHPRIGQVYPGTRDTNLRRQVIAPYLIIYYVEDAAQVIGILTVRHGRQRALSARRVLKGGG